MDIFQTEEDEEKKDENQDQGQDNPSNDDQNKDKEDNKDENNDQETQATLAMYIGELYCWQEDGEVIEPEVKVS